MTTGAQSIDLFFRLTFSNKLDKANISFQRVNSSAVFSHRPTTQIHRLTFSELKLQLLGGQLTVAFLPSINVTAELLSKRCSILFKPQVSHTRFKKFKKTSSPFFIQTKLIYTATCNNSIYMPSESCSSSSGLDGYFHTQNNNLLTTFNNQVSTFTQTCTQKKIFNFELFFGSKSETTDKEAFYLLFSTTKTGHLNWWSNGPWRRTLELVHYQDWLLATVWIRRRNNGFAFRLPGLSFVHKKPSTHFHLVTGSTLQLTNEYLQ